MRGEHRQHSLLTRKRTGSSPHARGAPIAALKRAPCPGIIPACAGSTAIGRALSWTRWDHPRMRGEHRSWALKDLTAEGSSPHARGALLGWRTVSGTYGIIPACAGSTPMVSAQDVVCWDHPRMRGEHAVFHLRNADCVGSSPHARGAHQLHVGEAEAEGIIPACAGSTRARGSEHESVWDHPRMRGEHE